MGSLAMGDNSTGKEENTEVHMRENISLTLLLWKSANSIMNMEELLG